jgi:uncharacterized protein
VARRRNSKNIVSAAIILAHRVPAQGKVSRGGKPGFAGAATGSLIVCGAMLTVILLLISNTFMTFAWYGHLKHRSAPILEAIVVSWLIAFGEYCFQVPANRIGYGRFTGYQLKIIQECVTLSVFVVFAYLYLGEPIRWNYALSFTCVLGAVFFGFWGLF